MSRRHDSSPRSGRSDLFSSLLVLSHLLSRNHGTRSPIRAWSVRSAERHQRGQHTGQHRVRMSSAFTAFMQQRQQIHLSLVLLAFPQSLRSSGSLLLISSLLLIERLSFSVHLIRCPKSETDRIHTNMSTTTAEKNLTCIQKVVQVQQGVGTGRCTLCDGSNRSPHLGDVDGSRCSRSSSRSTGENNPRTPCVRLGRCRRSQ